MLESSICTNGICTEKGSYFNAIEYTAENICTTSNCIQFFHLASSDNLRGSFIVHNLGYYWSYNNAMQINLYQRPAL